MKRDWLQKQYPDGIGLGDLIREYIEYMEFNRQEGGPRMSESIRRETELRSMLNYMYKMNATPVFVEE